MVVSGLEYILEFWVDDYVFRVFGVVDNSVVLISLAYLISFQCMLLKDKEKYMNQWMKMFQKKSSLWKVYSNQKVFLMKEYNKTIPNDYVELCYQNSMIPLQHIFDESVRVECGVYVREGVVIGKRCILLMGCIVNVGASIDEDTMIDMGAVIGSGAMIGKRCHIGANAVIAGCLEPKSESIVIIEDDVLIGANATVLSGIRVGKGAIVGAGAVVTKDVLHILQ